MADQFGENIQLIRVLAKLTQDEFATIVDTTKPTLQTNESGRTLPKPHILKRMADFAGITTKDLINKKLTEKDLPKLKLKESPSVKFIGKTNLPGIPYYEDVDVFGGKNNVLMEPASEYDVKKVNFPGFNDCDAWVNYSGNSMYPKYVGGDILALKEIKDLEMIQFGQPHVIITDEQRLAKYIKKSSDKNSWTLVSENEKRFDPFDIKISKVRKLFIIRGSVRKETL